MKRSLIILTCFLITSTAAFSQNYALLAKNYKVKEGDTLTYQLYAGKGLKTEDLEPGHADSVRNITGINGGKKIDSIGGPAFSAISLTAGKSGQNYLAFEFTGEPLELPSSDLSSLVKAKEAKGADAAENTEEEEEDDEYAMGTEYIAKPHYSLKVLTCTDKNGGKLHASQQDQQLEITLSQSPYKLLYGDDIIGSVTFKGKPMVGISVNVYVKSAGDNVYSQEYRTDEEGRFFFKLNRSGTWLIQTAYAVPSETGDSDYEYWQSAFSFGF